MKPELGSEIDSLGGSEHESKSTDPGQPESNGSGLPDRCHVPRVSPSEANGFAVYTRNKRLKGRSEGVTSTEVVEAVSSNGAARVHGSNADNVDGVGENLGTPGFGDGVVESQRETTEIEVKEDPRAAAVARSDEPRRPTRAENGNSGDLLDSEGERTTALGTSKAKKKEMKISKKILVKGRPTTVRELFETGLLEGYPVFYNGGKRGLALRGTIKDSGILCSCSLCKGTKVVLPCQFEIHACKLYRRASQYICLENGKSLLDVVKECRKSSAKSLEETIRNFVGTMPVKELVICRNCNGSFLAMAAPKMQLLCDSCMIMVNSEIDAECVKSRPLEPLLGLTIPEKGQLLDTPANKYLQGGKKRKHSQLNSSTKFPLRSSQQSSTRKKGQQKIKNMVLQISTGPKSCGYDRAFLHDSPKRKTTRKILKKSLDTSSSKSLEESGSPSGSVQQISSLKITKKDQTMHKLVFGSDGLPDGTEVAYYSHGRKLRDGYKMGSGIICRCCSTLVSPSQFEAHAGWAARRKPYMYIYTSNGVSLHEFAISLLKGCKYSSKKSDDLCTICGDGGKLVLCDGCPRTFHKECASLSSFPHGDWYCIYCQKMFQREKFVKQNANTVAAGRVLDIDSMEQITNLCIRIVKQPEEDEMIACMICRCYDFSKSGFGPRTVILCDQCEKEYHVGCLKKHRIADLKELPKGNWFCTSNCKWMHSALQDVLNSGAQELPDSSFDVYKKKLAENCMIADVDFDMRWRLLNGKVKSRETRVLLSQAVAIFHDCFDPIVDPETGRDFIPTLVYGRNIRGRDFSGMYCAMLTVNSIVVSAGILRIFGHEVAELPLAATRISSQSNGYFHILFACIEKLLAYLNVQRLVLPATDDAKSIWMEKFGFEEIPDRKLLYYRRTCWQMLAFKGTSMLEKAVSKCLFVTGDPSDPDVPLQDQ